MTQHSLLSLAVSGLCALILLGTQPHQALGSRQGSLGLTGGAVVAPPPGMCAIAVAIHGYQCQEFDVTTDDGYILSVQRIPQSRAGGGGNNKQPVLLQHGVLVDGMTWILNSPDQSLAFILADNGFDVWISNIRGTRFSRRHVTLDPSDSGTLIALASFSKGRQIDKVKSAALLSPIAYLSHMTTALGDVAAKAFLMEITKLIGFAEFNPSTVPVVNFLKALCAQSGVDCYDLLASFTVVRDGIVSKYDYGNPISNIVHYGQARPPIYNLSNIPRNFPLFMSYGGRDALSDVRDVGTLLDSLKLHDPNKLTVQYIKDYAHADFIMGVTAKDLVFNQMIAFFRDQK
ncbi:Myzus persicae-induced lipase 1 [Actinidia rufa]|uniref:Myzus persicae-induced lipase 1 n=1 Tax=Actinidia rufa TaxID=165716 RepID=A0A7J0DAL9_9ERIC|nr:Myzus persicae-induced lipase 1 [Actinidia rufa]